MKSVLRIEGEITKDGHLLVELEDLKGAGLTAEEIAASPEIGAWADDPEVCSGAEYVDQLRGTSRYSW